ncbi:tetratricopeptide repeat protein [Actinacidiphila glaucinigra]|uniref:tetratricopeptide repeat protein n=1 Tax=Actinacidiphila glaucinigra TaxID=235986 RepID=UPI0035DB4E8E
MAFEHGSRHDPGFGLEQAADCGDTRAMMHLADSFERRDTGQTERWLQRAAEAGEPEAMYRLARLLTGQRPDESEYWYRRAAVSQHVQAMYVAGTIAPDTEDGQTLLQHAAQRGHTDAALVLGRLRRDQGRYREAEHWLRTAAENDTPYRVEMSSPEDLEAGLGPRHQACLDLADLLETQGGIGEARHWRDKADGIREWERNTNSALFLRRSASGTVVVTAVVATAVIPFVQSLVSKVAEDAYGQARELVRRMLRRAPAQPDADNAVTLLIADDPDERITLCLWSNITDEALRALSSLDLNDLTAQRPDRGRVRLVWNPATSRWQIRGDQGDQ